MLEAGNYRTLKSFLPNSLRLSLLNEFWITTLICCLAEGLSLEPPTDFPSLRPMRLRKLCTNFSPKVIFPRVRVILLLCFLPEKDGKLQICVDYRALNKETVRNYFAIPHTDGLINNTQGS